MKIFISHSCCFSRSDENASIMLAWLYTFAFKTKTQQINFSLFTQGSFVHLLSLLTFFLVNIPNTKEGRHITFFSCLYIGSFLVDFLVFLIPHRCQIVGLYELCDISSCETDFANEAFDLPVLDPLDDAEDEHLGEFVADLIFFRFCFLEALGRSARVEFLYISEVPRDWSKSVSRPPEDLSVMMCTHKVYGSDTIKIYLYFFFQKFWTLSEIFRHKQENITYTLVRYQWYFAYLTTQFIRVHNEDILSENDNFTGKKHTEISTRYLCIL